MKTIGVFDSGFGGLTVLRAMLPLLPDARYVYLGDTARLPYGSKSQETIARYAVSSAKFLVNQGAELLVIACNTATALALDEIRAAVPIRVVGVIQPGVEAALAVASSSAIMPSSTRISPQGQPASNSPHVMVLATAATMHSGAYTRALNALGLRATEKACPLLVPLVEENWLDEPAQAAVTLEVLHIYLLEALAQAPDASILLLGCTHYPLLKPLIEATLRNMHHSMRIIDSAEATAYTVAAELLPATPESVSVSPDCTFYATDSVEKFRRLGSAFFGRQLPVVHHVDLESSE